MTTNVPPVTFGPNGFIVPSAAAVLDGVQLDINAAFGGNLSYALTTPQGQLAVSESALVSNTYAIFLYYTQQLDPTYASGRSQDAIGRLYNIERLPAEPTALQVACDGLTDVSIPVGALVNDSSNNIYVCTGAGTISAGSVTLSFAAAVPGPTAVPSSLKIYQAIPGWDAARVISGVIGKNTETRAQFEARRQASLAKNAIGSLPAVLGAVLAVSGVLDAYVTENVTGSPVVIGGVTLAAHSLYVAAVGGADTDVATAIWKKKAPGCGYTGSTTTTIDDTSAGYVPPYPSYAVSFTRPSSLAILFVVSILASDQVPSDALTQIQGAIVSAFSGGDGGPIARIGSVIYGGRFYSPVAALGTWAIPRSIKIGSNNTAGAAFRAKIVGTTMTVQSVQSGTIAVGQTVSGNDVQVGTTITALGSGTGGTGTYTVSDSQAASGETFTATGTGTSLAISVVTGTIKIGDYVIGTGVPADTYIMSQTSGVTGGSGFYVTNNATTSSADSLSCIQAMQGAAANLDQVTVQIDQEPTINANNIILALV